MKKIILLIVSMFFVTSVWAYDFASAAPSGQMLYYNIIPGTTNAVVTSQLPYSPFWTSNVSLSGNLTIPSTVTVAGTTFTVVSIGTNAFIACVNLNSVAVPNTVTLIDSNAFYACNGMSSITIPSSVTNIKTTAFMGCVNLNTVYYSGSIGDWCGITFEDPISNPISQSSNATLYIGGSACTGAQIIPQGTTTIGNFAFNGYLGLTAITIPSSITTIGVDAFNECVNLTTVNYNASNCSDFESSPFFGCSQLSTVNIGSSVQRIPDEFLHVGDSLLLLTSISIPNSVTYIGENAFFNCSGLTSIVIPNSVTTIGPGAFTRCSSVSTLTIGSSVNCIGASAFQLCTNLNTVNYNAYTCTNYSYPFDGCSSLRTVIVGDNVHLIPSNFLYNNQYVRNITIGNSIDSIGPNAFINCGDPYLPSNGLVITHTGTDADWCRIKFANSRSNPLYRNPSASNTLNGTTLGNQLRRNGSIVTSVNIPNITKINAYAFYNVEGVVSFHIPNTISEIGDSAFYDVLQPDGEHYVITNLQVDNPNPPLLGSGVFGLSQSPYSRVKVPCGKIWQYRNSTWGTYWPVLNNWQEQFTYSYLGVANITNMGTVTATGTPTCANNTVTFTATANNGYHFSQWSNGSTSNPLDVSVVQDTVLMSYFVSNTQNYTITVTSDNPIMGNATGGGSYPAGSPITISAIANSGYHFTHWQDNNTNNPRTITVTSNATYTAYFEADGGTDCSIVTSFPWNNVFDEDLSCWNNVDVDGDGYTWNYYSGWAVSESYSYFDGTHTGLTPNNWLISRCIQVPNNAILSWTAQSLAEDYFSEHYGVYISSTGSNPSNFTNQIFSETLPSDSPSTHSVSLASYAGQTIRVAFRHYNTNNEFILAIGNISIEQVASSTYTINVTSNNTSMGTVSGGGTYAEGSTATISATANSGYQFVRWQDNNTQNPRTVTVNADVTYTAYFEAITSTQYAITVNSNNSSMGTVSGGGTYNQGATATLTATPNSGYHFTQWQDGNTQNPRTITVSGNATYTAYFEADGSNDDCPTITSFPWNATFDETLTCWKTVDADGDGYNWLNYEDYVVSESYSYFDGTNQGLTPDNWLISQRIRIPSSGSYSLSWMAQSLNDSYYNEHYSVYVSTTGDNPGNFTTQLFTETLATANAVNRSKSLENYRGQTIRIAFRHHNTNDVFVLGLGNVKISQRTQGIEDIENGVNCIYVEGLIIHISEIDGQDIAVYSIDGRVVASLTNAAEQCSIPVPAAGVYMVKVGYHPARKVVVIR